MSTKSVRQVFALMNIDRPVDCHPDANSLGGSGLAFGNCPRVEPVISFFWRGRLIEYSIIPSIEQNGRPGRKAVFLTRLPYMCILLLSL